MIGLEYTQGERGLGLGLGLGGGGAGGKVDTKPRFQSVKSLISSKINRTLLDSGRLLK